MEIMHYADILQWHVWVLHSTGTSPSGCWSKSPYSPTTWIKPPPRCCQNWNSVELSPHSRHWGPLEWVCVRRWNLLACTRCVVQHQLAWRLTSSSLSPGTLQCVASAAAAVQWANHGQYSLTDTIHLMFYIINISNIDILLFFSVVEHRSMSLWSQQEFCHVSAI